MAMLMSSAKQRVDLASRMRCIVRWKSNEVKMVKMLQKMYMKHNQVTTKSSKRKTKPNFDWLPKNTAIDERVQRKKIASAGQQRRAHQVGKVLYDYMVQIINTGELDPYLAANDVEITRIKVEPDLSTMNVYWSATGTDDDIQTEEILRKNQGKLRHLLTTYHLLSYIPHITFVKDKAGVNARKVEEILNTIDFGPDFVPTVIPSQILEYPHHQEKVKTFTDSRNKIDNEFYKKDLNVISELVREQMDENNESSSQDGSVTFKNDLYGVQHSVIMKNLISKKCKENTKSANDNININSFNKNLVAKTLEKPDYKQLAVKLKKPKAVKARYLCWESEREYIYEELGRKNDNEEEHEIERESNYFDNIDHYIKKYSSSNK